MQANYALDTVLLPMFKGHVSRLQFERACVWPPVSLAVFFGGLLFLKRKQRVNKAGDWGVGEQELRGVEGEETVVGVCCMREESIFSETKLKMLILIETDEQIIA